MPCVSVHNGARATPPYLHWNHTMYCHTHTCIGNAGAKAVVPPSVCCCFIKPSPHAITQAEARSAQSPADRPEAGWCCYTVVSLLFSCCRCVTFHSHFFVTWISMVANITYGRSRPLFARMPRLYTRRRHSHDNGVHALTPYARAHTRGEICILDPSTIHAPCNHDATPLGSSLPATCSVDKRGGR